MLINAINYAYPKRKADGLISVTLGIVGQDWELSVVNNRVGKALMHAPAPTLRFGTATVKALVKQLDARLGPECSQGGMWIAIFRAEFIPLAQHQI